MEQKFQSYHDMTWVIVTPEPKKLRFSPLLETIDWYNHQLLAKAFKKNQITLSFGEKTLLQVSPLLHAAKMVAIGTGKRPEKVDELCKLIEATVTDLDPEDKDKGIWVAVSEDLPDDFRESLTKHLTKKYKNVTVG